MPLVNNTRFADHRAAIKTWFQDRTGLGSGSIIWLNQPTPRKALPSGTLHLLSRGKQMGQDQIQEVQNGNVIERTYLGVRQMVIQAEIYTVPASDDADLEAMEILEQALGALSMRQVIDDFQAVDLAALDYEVINVDDELVGERWERRAIADIRFSYRTILFDDGTDAAPDDGTFIETVDPITTEWAANVHVFVPAFTNAFT